MSFCRIIQKVRYALFPDARRIDERTEEIDQQREELKQRKAQTDQLVRHANRPDVLRNLVIAMTSNGTNSNRHSDT